MIQLLVDNSKLVIDLDAIESNISAIRMRSSSQKIMAVIKADAYGHGAVEIGTFLEKTCDFFGVSSVTEALELRNAGISIPILILGTTPTDSFYDIIPKEIRPAIYRYEDAVALSRAAADIGMTAYYHIAVDTGMSRIGFQVTSQDADIVKKMAELPLISAEGIFSHYATADCADLARAQKQHSLFLKFDNMLHQRGIAIPIRHLNNSAGIMNFPGDFEMVRSGIITYGMYPSDEVDRTKLSIRPAMQWVSFISHCKELEPGREIGYGGTFSVKNKTRVATIPVGYADGYRRNLSNRFYVLIKGQKAPILGRVCMDQMMVDVSHIPDTDVGDEVILIGGDGSNRISIEEISAFADSFNYEFSCGISRRVPRVYIRHGSVEKTVRYLL